MEIDGGYELEGRMKRGNLLIIYQWREVVISVVDLWSEGVEFNICL